MQVFRGTCFYQFSFLAHHAANISADGLFLSLAGMQFFMQLSETLYLATGLPWVMSL